MAWSRTSRQSRGYGAEWDRLRIEILRRDNSLCQCRHCKTEDRVSLATDVDHIVSRAEAKRRGWTKAQTEHPSNLQAINPDCHKRKNAEDSGGEFKPRPLIGLDGFPIG